MLPNFVQVGKEKIKYFETGKGKPIIFAHGTAQKPTAYAKLINDLAKENYKIIAPEMYGINYLKNQPTSIKQYAKLTSDFITALKLKKVYLIGHSIGGIISISIAKNHPDKIQKVIALSPVLPMERRGAKGLLKGLYRYAKSRIKKPLNSCAFFCLNSLFVGLRLLKNPKASVKIIADMKKVSLKVFQISIPALIIHAQNDELIELSSKTKEKIKSTNIILKQAPNLDHNWPIENHKLMLKQILNFLNAN